MLDDRDRQILKMLQHDSETPLNTLAEMANLSPSACSRRIQRLREEGYIARRIAVLNRKKINLGITVYVLIKTSQHSAEWLEAFRKALSGLPEIVEAHRLSGNLDYLLKLVVSDIEHYDAIYKELVRRIDLFDVASYFSMQTLKDEMVLPTHRA